MTSRVTLSLSKGGRKLQLCFDKLGMTLALVSALAGCTTGQANTTPPVTGGGGGGSGSFVLQLAMGTVNFERFGRGLNVLETFRDASGFTALPITTVKLRGPTGFAGPKGSRDPGSGASGTIPLGSASNQFVIGTGITPPMTTIAAADGFGIGPPSCSCPGINFYPFQPQFADATESTVFSGGPEPFYGGPPAFPPTQLAASALSSLVSIPSEWPEGFYFIGFSKTPPVGTYTIEASFSQNGANKTDTASALLHSTALLPALQPAVHSDGKGGLIVHLVLPHGVKQALVNVIDANVPPAPPPAGGKACPTGLGFATLKFTSSGTQRVPDNLGNYGQGGAPTFCKNDLLNVQAIGFDYDDFGLGPPGNTQQRPPMPARADATYAATVTTE